MQPKPGWLTMPRVTLGAIAVLTSAVAAQQVQTPVYPETRKTTTSTPITASGCRSLPLARGRHLRRDRRVGRGAEQGHLPVPREDSVPRAAARPRDAAERLREVLGAVAEGAVLLLQPERRPAEPERALHPEGIRRHARGADRSQHLVGGRHRARCRAFAPSKDAKYAVYGISRSGSDWQEYKVMELATKKTLADTHRVGEGLGRRVAGRRLLLQPLSGAGEGQGEGVDQREPPGLLPQDRHAAVAGRRSSTRTRPTRSASTRSTRPRTSASPS